MANTPPSPLSVQPSPPPAAAARACCGLCDKTPDGRVALHVAAAYGHAAILELLIERGREVNAALEKELRAEGRPRSLR